MGKVLPKKCYLGDLSGAQEKFRRVSELDDSRETREHIAAEMGDIGQRAFDYGTSLQEEGKEQEGISYKRFAMEPRCSPIVRTKCAI